MTEREQGVAFAKDLDALVDRYRSEFDLSYPVVIGILHIKAQYLADECNPEEQ